MWPWQNLGDLHHTFEMAIKQTESPAGVRQRGFQCVVLRSTRAVCYSPSAVRIVAALATVLPKLSENRKKSSKSTSPFGASIGLMS